MHTVFSHLLPYNLDFPFEPSWWMRLCSPLFALLFLLAPLGKRLGLSSCIVTEKCVDPFTMISANLSVRECC